MSAPKDVRGGICGGTDKTGVCGVPLLFGRCPHHGQRDGRDLAAPEAEQRPKRSGWVDGRTTQGRRLRGRK